MHDGQKSLWEQEKDYQQGWNKIEILDLLHLIPRIWSAAKILAPDSVEKFVKEKLLTILMGGIGIILMGFRRMTTTRKLSQSQKEAMRTIINYLETNKSTVTSARPCQEAETQMEV